MGEDAYLLMEPRRAAPGALGFSLMGAGWRRCHGQKFKAAMVRVVSSELEKVRVDTYHCQGLRAVIHSLGAH